jgi:hypothetical protein
MVENYEHKDDVASSGTIVKSGFMNIYIYITLRYVSVQGSAVSALQERNRTY